MTTQLTFSVEAINIANDLLAKSSKDQYGRYWPMASHYTVDDITNIHAGNAGIGLFFLELFKETRLIKYLRVAIETTDWLFQYCATHPSDNYSFLKGRMGIAYLAAKLYKLTNEEKYLWQALAIVQKCDEFLDTPTVDYSFLDGTAGTLLALLHIHKVIDAPLILTKIDKFIGHLLDGIHVTPTGVYWLNSNQSEFPQGQCGFAKGSGGIGFVFLELGYYFDNDTFSWIAEQALIYDTTFYHQCLIDGQTVEQYSLASIGLSRLRAYELLKKNIYRKEALTCITRTAHSNIDTVNDQPLSLYHGAIGHAELLIQSYFSFCDIANLYTAEQIAYQILGNKKHYLQTTEDCGLLSGKAGLGYFYLRLANPELISSPLCPKLDFQPPWITDADKYPNITIFQSEVTQKIVEKTFARTFNLLVTMQPDEVIDYLSEDIMNPSISFHQFIGTAALDDEVKAWVQDIFQLEAEKHRMQGYVHETKLAFMRRTHRKTKAIQFLKEKSIADLLNYTLQVDSTARIITTQWNWSENIELLPYEVSPTRANQKILLTPTHDGIVEQPLCSLSSSLLERFCGNKTVEMVIDEIIKEVQVEMNVDKEEVYQSLLTQLEQFINLGVLVTR